MQNLSTMDSIVERLVSASSSGDLPSVREIYQDWKSAQDPVTAASAKEPTHALRPALEAAAYKNQLGVIAYFLEQGFVITDIVVKNAIEAQSTQALELFLEHGWDINTRWRHYKFPAIRYEFPFTPTAQASITALGSSAISRDSLPLVTWFLDHGASPNLRCTPYTSNTPLAFAVINASLSIVKLLIAHGARVDEGNLLVALSESNVPGRLAILGYLVERGVPMNELSDAHNPPRFIIRSKSGLGTPLHSAVRYNRIAIAAALLAHGVEKGKVDTKGRTPLVMARELGLGEMVKLLEGDDR